MSDTGPTQEDVWFVYDGECPICTMGASLYRLRQSVGTLHTVDARKQTEHPVMQEVNAAGIDLDEGMVIKYQGTLYQGEEALHVMAKLGADTGIFNKTNNRLFAFPAIATLLYPSMKAARNVALSIKGSGKIRNLAGKE